MKTPLTFRRSSMGIVRLLWPHAPRIGTPDRIWCGVCKHEDGRDVCCTVGGTDDRYRKCKIIGYQIELGDKDNPDTEGREGVTLLVKVRMNQAHPLIERVHISHIECLESYAKKPNIKTRKETYDPPSLSVLRLDENNGRMGAMSAA